MILVGVTGGIGSGKSTVCSFFEALGIAVYYADDQAKYLSSYDPVVKKEVESLFGKDIYIEGQLDRKKIASLIFSNEEYRIKLNQIIHPAVKNDFELWLLARRKEKRKYVIKEAAILIETGNYKEMDKVILVRADINQRIEWLEKRNGWSVSEIQARINSQMSDEEKMKFVDFIIWNREKKQVQDEVLQIHKLLSR